MILDSYCGEEVHVDMFEIVWVCVCVRERERGEGGVSGFFIFIL